MLAVIQHHQGWTPAKKAQHGVRRGAARLVVQFQRARHRDRHQVGVRDRRQIHEPRATELTGDLRRELRRQPCLAHAAGAGQGHQPVIGHQPVHLGDLRAAPHKTRQVHRKTMGHIVIGHPQRREIDTQFGMTQLHYPLRTRQIPQRVRPQVNQPCFVREAIDDQAFGHAREHRLAPMRQVTQARGPVDGRTGIVAFVAERDLPGVHAYAQPDRCEPRSLQVQRGGHGIRRAGEREDKAITLTLLDWAYAVMGGNHTRHGFVEARHGSTHVVWMGLPQPGGSLDVGQQQCHCAPWQQLAHPRSTQSHSC
ncbi:Uncharacterised protein [Mycobacterium tuberculosis]|nr:Uncharacterised protein [Mycobacterium tuberculosis]